MEDAWQPVAEGELVVVRSGVMLARLPATVA